MVADSNSQIAWHRAQIKKHRETLQHLETGRFRYGQIAGAKSAGQIEKTVAELRPRSGNPSGSSPPMSARSAGLWGRILAA